MTVEVALIISIVSVVFSVFFGCKNNGRANTKEVEERVAWNTKVDMKLDSIAQTTTDIKYDVSATKKDVKDLQTNVSHLAERVAKVESSSKQAHKRLDEFEKKDSES